jgi:LacI family transcriptional regulator
MPVVLRRLNRGRVTIDSSRAPQSKGLLTVAVLADTSDSYGRGLLHGIAKFNREKSSWLIASPQGLPLAARAEWLKRWSGDGLILGAATTPRELPRRCTIPIVDVRRQAQSGPCAHISVDLAHIAEVGAKHLLDCGLRNLAFCGRAGSAESDDLAHAFQRTVAAADCECHPFRISSGVSNAASWHREQNRLAEWIWSLPKPIGIMACDDETGARILDACRRCGSAVPDDVAVIGVGNDAPLCDLADPPLSSIELNAEGVGYEAAAMLARMMEGQPASASMKIPARGVVARRSTDLAASEDEEVAGAVRYIRDHACRGLQVMDVLAHLGMSRASLQQRMKETVGRTIHQEIQRVRLGRAKELLAMSNIAIKQVARESGFASVQYMTRVFRAVTGETPARYRARRKPVKSLAGVCDSQLLGATG